MSLCLIYSNVCFLPVLRLEHRLYVSRKVLYHGGLFPVLNAVFEEKKDQCSLCLKWRSWADGPHTDSLMVLLYQVLLYQVLLYQVLLYQGLLYNVRLS